MLINALLYAQQALTAIRRSSFHATIGQRPLMQVLLKRGLQLFPRAQPCWYHTSGTNIYLTSDGALRWINASLSRAGRFDEELSLLPRAARCDCEGTPAV